MLGLQAPLILCAGVTRSPKSVSYLQFALDVLLSIAAVLSAEEARLWSVVTANSLDFNSWIALIEETEKNAEVIAWP